MNNLTNDRLDYMRSLAGKAVTLSGTELAAVVNRILSAEAQLAELRGRAEDYTRYDCGCCGYETLSDHPISRCPKCNHDKIGVTPLRSFAVPPAASQHVPGEPDYWVYDTKFGLDISREKPEHEENTEPYFPVFKAVPVASQPYTVPDKMPPDVLALIKSSVDELFDDHDAQEIWNACRAAMLQSGNSPVIPDGSISVPLDLFSELRDWAYPRIEDYCEMWTGRRDDEFPALRKLLSDADALIAADPQHKGE